jgi:hypothetical protein
MNSHAGRKKRERPVDFFGPDVRYGSMADIVSGPRLVSLGAELQFWSRVQDHNGRRVFISP